MHDQVVVLSETISLFDGGYNSALSLSDPPTWRYAGTAGDLWGYAFTYDPRRGAVLRFGGASGNSFTVLDDRTREVGYGDTGPVVIPVTTGNVLPAARRSSMIAYDSTGNRAIMFGGMAVSSNPFIFELVNDTWQLAFADSPGWHQMQPKGAAPSPREGAAVLFDELGRRMLMFGPGDAWQLMLAKEPSTVTWAPLFDGTLPGSAGDDLLAALDPLRRKVLLRSARGRQEVWSHDLDSGPWSVLTPGASVPGTRMSSIAVYDSLADRLIVFPEGEVMSPWVLQNGAWSTWAISGPTPRYGFSAVLDETRHRAIIFGGQTAQGEYCDDAWALSLDASPQWTPMPFSGARPSARDSHVAVYDPISDRMLLFGGRGRSGTGNASLSDLWALSFTGTPAWSPLQVPGGPSARQNALGAIDTKRNRLIISGGNVRGSTSSDHEDTWALALSGTPQWVELGTAGNVPVLFDAGAYDPVEDALVVAGGWVALSEEPYVSAAILPLDPGTTWSQLSADARPPRWRIDSGGVWDSRRSRLLTLGGITPHSNQPSLEVWSLYPRDITTPVLASLVGVDATSRSVRIEWSVSQPHQQVRIERREDGSAWIVRVSTHADPSGRIRWSDEDVVAGAAYDYRLAFDLNGTSITAGETHVTVPQDAVTRLDPVTPNPSRTGVNITFTLPNRGAGRLELIDLAGRRVDEWDLAGFGAGEHVIAIRGTRSLEPGIYFVKLSGGGHEFTRRFAIVP